MRILAKKHFKKRHVPVIDEKRCTKCGSRTDVKIGHGGFLCPRHTLEARLAFAKKNLQTHEQAADGYRKMIVRAEAELAAL
jgi:hypothetical protein